jgi:hypothetical protein
MCKFIKAVVIETIKPMQLDWSLTNGTSNRPEADFYHTYFSYSTGSNEDFLT